MRSLPEARARHPKRTRVGSLERRCAELIARGGRPALLSIALRRDDRVRALAGREDTFRLLASVLDRVEPALLEEDRYAVVAVDELWVCLASAPSESIVRLASTRLRAAVDGHYDGLMDDGTACRVAVRATIGGAWIDGPPGHPAALANAAARALADAHGVEDRIATRRAGSDDRLARMQLAARLREALAANELEVWYQPQLRLADLGCPSLEALVRWPQPPHSAPVDPATVVSICEETGLIAELTRFCVNTVLRNMADWGAAGVEPQVAINLSALSLSDASFPLEVAQSCETWTVAPGRLTFELTEGSIARHERATLEFMRRLRALGCGLSIDDFGTGYSSFAYLRQFPVNELKIDRVFVQNLATDGADRRIVEVLVGVAHMFGLRALAEGVEDGDSVRFLRSIGCDLAQGWHFARAMPADEVPGWLTSREAAASSAGTLQTA
jgi:EAL domain-containing protein (putative c-di-GMP-specific phosphodiesterase class I)